MSVRNHGSILLTGAPRELITPETRHVETRNDAAVDFSGDGKVIEVRTPPDAFKRVHELMHTRHSNVRRQRRQYAGVREQVWQIVEDCRIHLDYWPWCRGRTPKAILESTNAFLQSEEESLREFPEDMPEAGKAWCSFATKLRQVAIKSGLDYKTYPVLTAEAGFETGSLEAFADHILALIRSEKEGRAARELEAAFFEPPPLLPGDLDEPGNAPRRKGTGYADHQPKMEIIELPHTEAIPEAAVRGYRRATSGGRLHRPSLHKPTLPQRLFMRRSPRELGGTILVDASGSMGNFDQVTDWCKAAPFGTIAYYAGDLYKGWLWVYARNGRRAPEIVEPPSRGNTVDGPALSWLMKQPRPRTIITDRGFCDWPDSEAQVIRLANLERAGEITVLDYRRKSRVDEY